MKNENSDIIRFAVIGFGRIGKRHAHMIQENEMAELVAIIDIDPKLESMASSEFGTPFFDGLEKFLESGIEADVLSVCTPNNLHAPLCIKGMEHGLHVICEKPMALLKADCEAMIQSALKVGRQIFVVMQNRYSPPSKWLKSVVESGALGSIYHVQVNCFWNRDSRYYEKGGWKGTLLQDGGTLFTQFSHFVDMLFWLFGDVKNESGRFYNFNHQNNTEFEDSGTISFDFLNGGSGQFNFSTSLFRKNFESSICIIAEKGTIRVGGQYMEQVEYCDIQDYEMPQLEPSNPPNDYGTYKGSAANHSFVIQNVVETLQGKSTISTNAMEGMKVVDIIERFYAFRK